MQATADGTSIRLAEIRIFPIKSLPPLRLNEVALVEGGALAGDRRWSIWDEQGNLVNGKRTARVHALDAQWSDDLSSVALVDRQTARRATFVLPGECDRLAGWLSEAFGFPVELREDRDHGWPDDTEAPGPTLVSTATLEEVARWFPPLSVESIRRRFRANLEIDVGDVPFWEDQLVPELGRNVHFQLGAVTLAGVNPCQRCPVPTRDAESGAVYPVFVQRFSRQREAQLPDWAPRGRFDHFYRLAVNTRGVSPACGQKLRLGDPLRLVAPESKAGMMTAEGRGDTQRTEEKVDDSLLP
jgi:hypothetical protein